MMLCESSCMNWQMDVAGLTIVVWASCRVKVSVQLDFDDGTINAGFECSASKQLNILNNDAPGRKRMYEVTQEVSSTAHGLGL